MFKNPSLNDAWIYPSGQLFGNVSNIFHLCRYFIGKTETITFLSVARLFNIPHLII